MSTIDIDTLKAHLSDRRWRLSNLYFIRDKDGKKVPFRPNATQIFMLDNLWFMNIIVKARQLGLTTLFTIFYLDQVLWSENKTAGIIAHREEDMRRIFRDKILFALRHLHPWLKELVGDPVVQTASELVFKNGSNIFVSMSTRGGTPNFLHISEYGYICAHDPAKADEILHGAINSVGLGQMVSIESTAEGREGHFYRLLMEAEKKRKAGRSLTELDFKSFFFPWWMDPLYTLSDNVPVLIDDEMRAYFDQLKNIHQIKLTKGQQAWYVKKRETVGDGIFEQFPSIIEECFMVTIKGAYFANEMSKVYEQNRIGFFPIDTKYEVNIAWDLGMNDSNTMTFYQEIGEEIRFVDYYENSGFGLEHYVNIIREKKYRIGKNILPHDVAVRDLSTGISREQFLWDLGLQNIHVMPKIGLMEGIEKTRKLFPKFRFNEASTTLLVSALHNYRRDYNKKLGVEMDQPRHDENSHRCFADDTLVLMSDMSYLPINEIKVGDFIMTPYGKSKVRGITNNLVDNNEIIDFNGIKVTKNHPILTGRGFIPMDTIRMSDNISVWKNKTLSWMEFSSEGILKLKEKQNKDITKHFHLLKRVLESYVYTDMSGKSITARYLKGALFIIKMAISIIMTFLISNFLRLLQNIIRNTLTFYQRLGREISGEQLPMHQLGTDQKKAKNGTEKMVGIHGKIKKKESLSVTSARNNIKQKHLASQNGAPRNVNITDKRRVYNLSTTHGMYIVSEDNIVVSNCDTIRMLALDYTERVFNAYGEESTDVNTQSFFG